MSDIATLWSEASGDWALVGPQLQSGGDLMTAVLISLFTDRLADVSDVIADRSGDPRGWWGDLGAERRIGSKIWLRMRAKQTDATLAQVKADIAEALKWLIDDEIAVRIDVLTEWTRPGMLGAEVTLFQSDGAKVATAFSWAWQGIN